MTNKKSVLITGCSSGIGLNAVYALQKQNYHVIASVRQSKDLEQFQQDGTECIQLDLSDELSIQKAVDYLYQHHPDLYGLVNNGAYGQAGAVEDLTRQALRDQFETNVFGTHELTQKLLPLFRKQNRGRVIQISSVLGVIALPLRGAYNASKFALEGLTDTQRLELHDTNIKMSLIEPGAIETKFRKNCVHYFEKNIDEQSSVYKSQYQQMRIRLERDEKSRFEETPDRVSKDILHALSSEKPKIRYRITVPTIIGAKLKRLLSARMMDKVSANKG